MSLKEWIRDDQHPLGSPLIGRITSSIVCRLGHDVVVMGMDTWDEDWLACRVCGARFIPADMIDEDTEVVYV